VSLSKSVRGELVEPSKDDQKMLYASTSLSMNESYFNL